MALQFLNSYAKHLTTLSNEIEKNQRSIEHVIDDISTLTSVVQRRFKQLVVNTIKKSTLNQDEELARDFQIKKMYFQIRAIQRFEAKKRALTRDSCSILDKYFTSLGQEVEIAQSNPVDTDDGELVETLASIKLHLNKPVEGDAVVVDVIRKLESRIQNEKRDQEHHDTDGDNDNIDFFSAMAQNEKNTFHDVLRQKTKAMASDMLLQMDNLQVFIDKVVGICLEMKDRYGTGDTSNADSDEADDEVADDDGNTSIEHCHCQTRQHGPMVECGNPNCEIKWYHFECVGLSRSPKGMWFCPTCVIFGDKAN